MKFKWVFMQATPSVVETIGPQEKLKFSKRNTFLKQFVLLETLLFVILFGWYVADVDHHCKTAVRDELEVAGGALNHMIEHSVFHTESMIKYIGILISQHGNDHEYIKNLVLQYQAQINLNNMLSWSSMSWADAEGNIVLDSRKGVLENFETPESHRLFLLQTKSHPWKLRANKPNLSESFDHKVVAIGIGVADEESKFLGTLFTTFDLEKFKERLQQKIGRFQKDIEFVVVDEDGDLLAQSEGSTLWRDNKDLINKTIIRHGSNLKQDLNLYLPSSSLFGLGKNLMLQRKAPYTYYMVTANKQHYNYRIILESLSKTLFHLALILMICFILNLFIIRVIVRPVLQLAASAHDIGLGKKEVKIKNYSSKELDTLATSLRRLVSQQYDLITANEKLRFLVTKAEAGNEAKSEFIRNIQHELRTPLNHIICGSNLLSSEFAGAINKEYLDHISMINESGKDLLTAINNIIAVADFESGNIKLYEGKYSLYEIVETALSNLLPKITENKLKLEVNLEKKLPKIMADHQQMVTAISHILSNSIDFTKTGGLIKVSASRRDSSIEIEIMDSGIGIDPKDLNAIKLAFAQSGGVLTKMNKGLGLGLCIVQSIIDLHGMFLQIESEKNKGTIVRIIIPKKRIAYDKKK
jgi:signal transduction histidine kinase